MDLYETKSRVGEALVESIFRRARYEISPCRSSQAAPFRFGREDFSPNFAVVDPEAPAPPRELLVKYRASIEQFVLLENQRGASSVFMLARRRWPALGFVLVTDHPEPARSCFQVVTPGLPGDPLVTVDLTDMKELRIFPQNARDHEALLRRIFGLLTGA